MDLKNVTITGNFRPATKFERLKLNVEHLIISFSQLNNFHLCDDVWYNGERYFINNGNRYDENNNHLWTIVKKEWNDDGSRDSVNVRENEIRKVFNLFNLKNGLFSHYKWWKIFWSTVEIQNIADNRK